MVKVAGVLILVVLLFLTYISNFYVQALADKEAEAVVSQWKKYLHTEEPMDLLSEYAPLPAYDRQLIDRYCIELHQDHKKLQGTKSVLHHENRPGCQAMIRGGWYPGWTIDDGIAFLTSPETYVR